MLNWYVTVKNRFGQPSTTGFESQEAFLAHQEEMMQDGSGMKVNEAYPTILYQGPSEDKAQAAWEKDFADLVKNPGRVVQHLKAELESLVR